MLAAYALLSNCRITKALLLVIVVVSLSLFSVLPNAHASGKQLKVGDTWTITGTHSYSDTGWEQEVGKYRESGNFTWTYKVDSVSLSTITISETDTVNLTSSSTGWFGSGTKAKTSTANYQYVINSTTLNVISETSPTNATGYLEGHPTYVLIDPAALRQGNTIMRPWANPTSENTTSIIVTVPAMVSGSQMLPLKGATLKLWNVTYTGDTVGELSYNTGSSYPYSVGPETDSLLYESTYGIVVGWSNRGTYTAFEHCMGCNGGWTEHYVSTSLLTSSNLNFTS